MFAVSRKTRFALQPTEGSLNTGRDPGVIAAVSVLAATTAFAAGALAYAAVVAL